MHVRTGGWVRAAWIIAVMSTGGVHAMGENRVVARDADREAVRQRALKVLTASLKDGPLQSMHAAEVLLWNGYSAEVRPFYEAAMSITDPRTRAGVWRVLAQVPDMDRKERESYVRKVRDVALDTKGPNADFALESLAKLGYAGRDQPFVDAARDGVPVMQVLARWVLANSGKRRDEAYLAELLDLPEPRMRAVTAYALRFMKKLQPATLKHIQERLQQEPPDAPDRVFYVITLYLHGPAAERSARKAELFQYAETGNPEAKYQALLMLGRWADDADLHRLEPYLNSDDADIRTGAANAILTIFHKRP
jgi:hypothetical protein